MSDALYENEEYHTDTSQDTGFFDPNPWDFTKSKNLCVYQGVSSIIFIYVFLMFGFSTGFTVFIIYIFISAIYYRTTMKLHSSRTIKERSSLQ